MSQVRTNSDLDLYVGPCRAFEWYWDASGRMPGLDVYENLDLSARAGVFAAFEHWGNIVPGERPLESRVNKEHDDPLIVCAKSGVHRFPAFHAGNDVWIVTGYYKKEGQKLDKTGKREITRAIKARVDYLTRVEANTYYERD